MLCMRNSQGVCKLGSLWLASGSGDFGLYRCSGIVKEPAGIGDGIPFVGGNILQGGQDPQ